MNFSEKLYALLTARRGVIKYAELFSIIETLLSDAYKRPSAGYISSGLVVTRWLSEGFLEVDVNEGGFRLKRPTILSRANGNWTYVGARFTPAIEYLTKNLRHVEFRCDEYAAPKILFVERPGQELNKAEATRLGCDVIGSCKTPASLVLAHKAGSIESRTQTDIKECDQALLHLRWLKLNPKDYSLSEAEVSKLTTGHYIVRNHNNTGKPIWKYIKLRADNHISQLEDWRWLYVSLMSDAGKMSEFFYEPRRKAFCVVRITGPYARQENWLPRELAEALGASSGDKSITNNTVQDVDGVTKSIVIYPNVPRQLALYVHDALGMNKTHPLRYLQF